MCTLCTAMHSAGRHLYFAEHGFLEKIFVAKKYLVTPSIFKLQKLTNKSSDQ